jgi:asparagine N-glycosylation enzyme membrane subunit Stt3
LFYSVVLDVQLLVGVSLLLLSPLVRTAVAGFAAMGSERVRFILVEHVPLMVLAVVLAHVGGIVARKASNDDARHRRSAIWYTLATLAVVLAVPWWRPLFPGLG